MPSLPKTNPRTNMSNAKMIGGFLVGAVVGAVIAFQVANKPKSAAESEAPAASNPAEVVLDTKEQKTSYVIGANIGGQLSGQGIEFDQPALMAGLQDALTGAEPRLSEEESHAAIQEIIADQQARAQERQAEQQAERQAQSEKNKAEGNAFLAENKDKEGVVTTDSGLQYKVLVEGTGDRPTAEDVVQVHYRGTLIDGTEFDSSYERGEPAEFPVTGVIPGWTEALQLMREGAKWEIYVPAELAYGSRGAGSAIGPDAVLIFEVELLKAHAKS
jgi:FKBP-type peptidyl-prolyl cis-trans isomerase